MNGLCIKEENLMDNSYTDIEESGGCSYMKTRNPVSILIYEMRGRTREFENSACGPVCPSRK